MLTESMCSSLSFASQMVHVHGEIYAISDTHRLDAHENKERKKTTQNIFQFSKTGEMSRLHINTCVHTGTNKVNR